MPSNLPSNETGCFNATEFNATRHHHHHVPSNQTEPLLNVSSLLNGTWEVHLNDIRRRDGTATQIGSWIWIVIILVIIIIAVFTWRPIYKRCIRGRRDDSERARNDPELGRVSRRRKDRRRRGEVLGGDLMEQHHRRTAGHNVGQQGKPRTGDLPVYEPHVEAILQRQAEREMRQNDIAVDVWQTYQQRPENRVNEPWRGRR